MFKKLKNTTKLFWEFVDRNEKIKKLAEETKTIEKSLEVRQDQEFLDYATKKLLIITKKQQQLL